MLSLMRDDELNERLHPWQEMYFDGPKMEDFPSTQMNAPVDWTYFGEKFNLEFHAGIIGSYQNPKDGTMSPGIGWFATHVHDAPEKRISKIEQEILDLLEGHKGEINSLEVVDKDSIEKLGLGYIYEDLCEDSHILCMSVQDPNQPWYDRVKHLVDELVELDSVLCNEEQYPDIFTSFFNPHCIHPFSPEKLIKDNLIIIGESGGLIPKYILELDS